MMNNNNTLQQKVYYNQGITMKTQQAVQKISQINQINNSNNILLSNIKLTLGYQTYQFPNKLSQDLHDIYTTSTIQKKLLDQIKSLNNALKNKQTISNAENQQNTSEIQRQIRKNRQLQKKILQLTTNNQKLQQQQALNKQYQKQIAELKKKLNSANTKNSETLKLVTFLRSKQLNSKPKQITQNDLKKMNLKSSITKIDDTQIIPIKNNQHCKEMLKIGSLKQIDKDRQSRREKQLERNNNKFTKWMEQFVERIENILMIRLQKEKESVSRRQDVRAMYKNLPRVDVKMTQFFFLQNEFPFVQILNDFTKIMIQALDIKYQNEKNCYFDNIQKMNKQLVQMVITQMRKCKGQIIQEFKLCGQKRGQIAFIYENLMDYDYHVLEMVSNVTLDKLRLFQTHPNRIVKEIDQELEDLKKHTQFLQSNFSPTQPHLLTKKILLNQKFNQALKEFKNSHKQNPSMTHYQFQQQRIRQSMSHQQNQLLHEDNQQESKLTKQQKRQIESRKLYKQAQQFVLEQLNQKSFQQQWGQLQQKVSHHKQLNDLQSLKELYFSMFLPQNGNKQKQQNNKQSNVQQNHQVQVQIKPPKMQQPHINLNSYRYINTAPQSNIKNNTQFSSSNKVNNPFLSLSSNQNNNNNNNQTNKKKQTLSTTKNYPQQEKEYQI